MLLPLMGKRRPVDLSFMNGYLPSGTSFARASTARVYNASSVLTEVAENVGAFEYDPVTQALLGLRIERQRQNILVHSNKIGDTANGWTNGRYTTVTLNDAIAPDGTQTASKILFAADDAGADVWQNPAAAVGGVRYMGSVYVKAGTASSVTMGVSGGYSDFSLSDTWTLISRADGTATPAQFRLRCHPDSVNKYFYAAFAQMEARTDGEVTTSRIITEASAVTRAADVLSFTIPSGVSGLRYVFDNDTTQDVAVSAGAYTVPTNLNRPHIKRIFSL